MIGYLLDTNVISALAPSKIKAPGRVAQWMEERSKALFISAVTVAEIESGVAKCRREGASRKASDLAAWLESVVQLYAERVLPLDVEVARVAGRFTDLARGGGHSPGFPDMAIAATAAFHRLTLLTRNLKDFTPLAIAVRDPFDSLPS